MRALILALAIVGAAGAASAGDNGAPPGAIRVDDPPPRPPGGVRKQAEDAIRQGLPSSDSAQFRNERAMQATSVKHGDLGPRIPGPVSIVCGQYNAKGQTGDDNGFAWFFVAIKGGKVLWMDVDMAADGPGSGYYGCKGAGLAS